ncbi:MULTISPECIES: putative copper homeostasis (lipo)protein LpqS [Mycobacteroides]|uniref:Uncharacterized protein n=1 Tax=Mycobacteroides chelonae TaxID=1774 RepID=A0A1S1M5A6_MYCCH|nr:MULTISPECIES: hypothetical protein [Mycobacteroides]SKM17194.1 Uncharacterised protein [Mycobacteroides abscessus subsp. bolletii]KRQ23779.1 hypothetical protein AOT86_16915 [Mycobacteroides sp. H072]KRQ36716.1 hypothetical protein AOT84_13740 [Mycobacteroides sp. H002]KRQ55105.1 hypothetical protein AOT85_03700 [Mycobacteroides sp. H054]KRQ72401.1 hypothetical protein AOT83_03040 [Mycobacteroides sp. H001]
MFVAGVIAALPVLHCTVMADAALPVASHQLAASASDAVEGVGQHIGRASQDFTSQIFDVIAGKVRSGNAFRMLWAAALVVTLAVSLLPLRVVVTRAPPRRPACVTVVGGRARLHQICVSRR